MTLHARVTPAWAPVFLGVALLLSPLVASAQSADDLVAEAMSAAPASVVIDATIMDWEDNVLREGSNGWVCFPSPPSIGNAPMCLDEAWAAWAQGWMTREEVQVEHLGIAYMLQGDDGSSNIDPYAEGPTADNEWVVEGPHLMVIVPDPALLDGLPTDPKSGGPYVMWKGTPYAPVMVPVY
jgi:hypothetical protein